MVNRITEMTDFDDLKNIIFKKLQEEIKEVNAFRLTGIFEAYNSQATKYYHYYNFFYTGWGDVSYCHENLYNYAYTVEDIKKLMIKISTSLKTSDSDVKLLNAILDRRRQDLPFKEIFNVEKLKDDTAKLQAEYNQLSWFAKWLIKYAY